MFFGTVKEKIKNIPEIKIVGDRFVFQSEVLFETGSIEIGKKGKIELKKFAEILLNLIKIYLKILIGFYKLKDTQIICR